MCLLVYNTNAQVTLTESFETTVPPTGWASAMSSGGTKNWIKDYYASYSISGVPNGSYCAVFDSYYATAGSYASLTSKPFDLAGRGTNTPTVSLYMYRGNTFTTDLDYLEVYINTTNSLTGATLLSSDGNTRINRPYNKPPETTIGWNNYIFTIPAGFSGMTNYIIFKAVSAYGDYVSIDQVQITSYPCIPPTIATTTPASGVGANTYTLGATASQGTVSWYAAATGGSALGTGTSYTTPNISATTTYYVGANYNGCVNTTRTSIVATVATHYDAGTGIAINGTAITNTAPDQTVTITGTGATTVTGTYPNFTINSTDNAANYNAGTGLTLTGNTINSVWTANGNDIINNNSGNVSVTTLGGGGDAIVKTNNDGQLSKVSLDGHNTSVLRGDGSVGPMVFGDTIHANVIIGNSIDAVRSIQLDGSITAGARGTGSIGQYSIVVGNAEPAFGYNTAPVASGKYSVSFGSGNTSSNIGSLSFGGGNTSGGLFSVAIGSSNISSDTLSFAFGSQNNCSKQLSFAFGNKNTVSGKYSIAIGKNNKAEANLSAIVGGNNNTLTVDAIGSAIIGGSNITASLPNTVYVPNLTSTGLITAGTMNIENQTTTNLNATGGIKVGNSSIILGEYNGTGLPNNIFAESSNLFLQSMSGANGYNTIINANNTGSVCIGTTTPDAHAKLNVAGNIQINNNDIFLRNSHHGLGWYHSSKKFNTADDNENIDGPVLYGYEGGALGSKYFATNPDFDVKKVALRWTQSGDVGIGTNEPQKKLHVYTYEVNSGGWSTGGGPSSGSIRVEHKYGSFAPSAWDLEPLVDRTSGVRKFSICTPENFSMFTIKDNGDNTANVGIGTSDPTEKLEVNGFGLFKNTNGSLKIGFNGSHGRIETSTALMLNYESGNDVEIGSVTAGAVTGTGNLIARHSAYFAQGDGNVSIGFPAGNTITEKLEVNGGIKLGAANTNSSEGTLQYTHAGGLQLNSGSGMKSLCKWDDAITSGDIKYINGNVGIGTDNVYKTFTVQGDVSFINYGNNHNNSFEILGQGQTPTSRGISIDDDPSGMMNFWIHDLQSSAFNFVKNDGFGSPASFSSLMTILQNGNIGIGLVDPDAKLQIYSDGNFINENNASFKIGFTSPGNTYLYMGVNRSENSVTIGGVKSNYNNLTTLHLNPQGGRVEIGTKVSAPLSDIVLAVNGKLTATEVKVEANVLAPDYVFAPDYKLSTLKEVDAFVKQNHHLPDVPSAKEFEKNGQNLGEMNFILLRKVEELTLHLIEQGKQIEQLQQDNLQLKKSNNLLQK